MLKRNQRLFVALSLLIGCAISYGPNAQAQEAETPPISTDRPSVGAGTDLVPVHSLQFESGAEWTRDSAADGSDGKQSFAGGPQTVVRFGLSHHVELQATLPNLHWPGATPGVQYDDLAIGTKLKIGGDNRGWPVALVGTLSLPSGSNERTSGAVDPSVLAAVAHNLPRNLQLSASASLASLSTNGGARVAQSQMAVDLGWCAREATCFFAEAAPFLSTAQDANGATFDGGLTLRISPRAQIDGRVGSTLVNGDHSTFATLGYSFRLDPPHH